MYPSLARGIVHSDTSDQYFYFGGQPLKFKEYHENTIIKKSKPTIKIEHFICPGNCDKPS